VTCVTTSSYPECEISHVNYTWVITFTGEC
jgi:hypothetical protein